MGKLTLAGDVHKSALALELTANAATTLHSATLDTWWFVRVTYTHARTHTHTDDDHLVVSIVMPNLVEIDAVLSLT